METLDYWTPADALALRCTVAQVGTLRPAPDVAQSIHEQAQALAPRALRALVRIMESGEGSAALAAAREVLSLAGAYVSRGTPSGATPEPASAGAPQALPEPDWLDPARRLSYGQAPSLSLPRQ